MLRQALIQCKKWRESLPELHVSVNFSALQFEDPQLAENVIATVDEIGLPGDALTVEITESVELHNNQQFNNNIKCLKHHNIGFAIDDFGTGYSNLGYLKQMNVDEIKIDRVFVNGIEKDTYNHKLISNVVEFARANSIRTCCEGVESTRELVTLETLLPDVIQGYLFDKPNTAEIIENTYIVSSTAEFKERIEFIEKIREFKEKMGVIHFDPKDVLRENEVGLWMIRKNQRDNRYELHTDATMERILSVNKKYTPSESYEFWCTKIHPDYYDYVHENITEMIISDNAVQMEFPWLHANLGDIMIRFSGKRVKNIDDMIILQGNCRVITDVIGA